MAAKANLLSPGRSRAAKGCDFRLEFFVNLLLTKKNRRIRVLIRPLFEHYLAGPGGYSAYPVNRLAVFLQLASDGIGEILGHYQHIPDPHVEDMVHLLVFNRTGILQKREYLRFRPA